MDYKRQAGFSLLEVMVVVIVIGVLAGLAIPNYVIQMKRVKNQEATTILTTLYEQQKDYKRRKGSYIDGVITAASVWKALDVSIPTMKNFKNLTLHGNLTASCTSGPIPKLATMTDQKDEYRLMVLDTGRIVCQDAATSACGSSICIKMGFRADW